jgi:2-polyprenyl-6-methoxyphenol hydroxylase-like FAD-dependent oxidoreductase
VNSRMPPPTETPVLIVGGGPVGLALALDLGRRGIDCVLVEQYDGAIHHPRATAQNARTMEFFRRWGIADTVRESGMPADFPHTVLYVTTLTGFEIARIERPEHGIGKSSTTSPERPQRCNQIWVDPILRELASSYDTVTLRYNCKLESFYDDGNRVIATIRDSTADRSEMIAAQYLIDCSGGKSDIRETLAIGMSGDPTLDHNVSVFLRIPELWTHHDKGKAALHHFIDATGSSRTLNGLDGRELWRLGLRGKRYFDNHHTLDVDELVVGVVGKMIPYELISIRRWVTRDLVADRYRCGHVFLAGDAAHLNSPSGGLGLNTGMGDVIDLGWKLAAVLQGWGAPGLLDTYELERHPIAQRNVGQATNNYKRQRARKPIPEISDDTPEGERARREWGESVVQKESSTFFTAGTALGYRYEGSPIVIDDRSPAPPDTISEYVPTARPGHRAPHAWLGENRSLIDFTERSSCCCDSMVRPTSYRSKRLLRAAAFHFAPSRSRTRRSPRSTSVAQYWCAPTATSHGGPTSALPIPSRLPIACGEYIISVHFINKHPRSVCAYLDKLLPSFTNL